MADLISNSKSYSDLLVRLKEQIRTAQVKAAQADRRHPAALTPPAGPILEQHH